MKTATDSANLTMESLALPQELYWDGKMEPISPSNELFSITESASFWLSDDNFIDGNAVSEDYILEMKPGMDILSGDDIVVEFCNFQEEWSNNKLPPLEVNSGVLHPHQVTKINNSFDIGSLKSENAETTVLTTLTPPQSPPQCSASPALLQCVIPTESAVNFNEVLQQALPTISTSSISPQQAHAVPSVPIILTAPTTPLHNFSFTQFYGSSQCAPTYVAQNDDDVRNSELVDEFLKSCVKELPNLNDDCESISSSSSSSTSGPESIATDEWLPDSSASSSSVSSPGYPGDEDNSQAVTLTERTSAKKRTRPYGRGIEDRKIRKKEQNKNAATRYRQKKKLEMEVVLNEEQKLAQRYAEHQRVLGELKREAKYLKTLIKEFFKNRK